MNKIIESDLIIKIVEGSGFFNCYKQEPNYLYFGSIEQRSHAFICSTPKESQELAELIKKNIKSEIINKMKYKLSEL